MSNDPARGRIRVVVAALLFGAAVGQVLAALDGYRTRSAVVDGIMFAALSVTPVIARRSWRAAAAVGGCLAAAGGGAEAVLGGGGAKAVLAAGFIVAATVALAFVER